MKITDITLSNELTKAVLEMGFSDFTAVQELTLPALLNGEDVVAEAPTGTGKTAAYCLPMLTKIHPSGSSVEGLVICPTRELAVQVIQELVKFSKYMPGVKKVAIYGGQKVSTQLRELKERPQIVVGTPGRLNDLIARKSLDISHVSYLVLDECDEMLEMGFIKDVNKIIDKVVAPHQTALFSATISSEIKKVADRYLKKDARRVQIKRTLTQENQIQQKYVLVSEEGKKEAIVNLLNSLSFTRAFVFCRTKHKVMQIEKILAKATHHAITSLQGNLSQPKRDRAMKAFRNYDCDVMVATDIAARGIDVNDVDLVVNYDVPEEDEFYLHRIGRTGRVDKNGVSYTFLTKGERSLIKKYEAMTHCPIEEYVIDKGNIMKNILESLEPTLQKDLKEEKDAVAKACDALSLKTGHAVTPLELAAALLKDKMEVGSAETRDDGRERNAYSSSHSQSIDRNKERKKFVTDPANQRFFINVGYEDGANEDSLKAFLVKTAKGLDLSDFADIYLKGTFSFFEVPKTVADTIVNTVENSTFGEKNVHVEKTERPQDGERPVREQRSHSYSHGKEGHSSYHSSGRSSEGSSHSWGDKRPFRKRRG